DPSFIESAAEAHVSRGQLPAVLGSILKPREYLLVCGRRQGGLLPDSPLRCVVDDVVVRLERPFSWLLLLRCRRRGQWCNGLRRTKGPDFQGSDFAGQARHKLAELVIDGRGRAVPARCHGLMS